MDETVSIVSIDGKGRLVIPKRVRTQAAIELNHELVARAIGPGRVELLDPEVLLARAREIGLKKLSGWKETEHEATRLIQRLVKRR